MTKKNNKGIKVILFDDKDRICDCCGKNGRLFFIYWKMAKLFPNFSSRYSALWICQECAEELLTEISKPMVAHDE